MQTKHDAATPGQFSKQEGAEQLQHIVGAATWPIATFLAIFG